MRGFVNTLNGMIKAIKDKLGNTNISTIGDGTVTGAINTINADLSSKADTNKLISGVYNNSHRYPFVYNATGNANDGLLLDYLVASNKIVVYVNGTVVGRISLE